MEDYPLTSSHELARRIVGRELRFPEDAVLLQRDIRPLLRKFGCPKTTPTTRGRWLIDEAMARRVADALGRPLR